MDRQKIITKTALIAVVVNIGVATMKIIVGLAASSLAIVSEGINNAADGASSLLTLIGTKLSNKRRDASHPFGYGRIEYLTGMIVGMIIMYAGANMLKESVDAIMHPTSLSVNTTTIILIVVSAIIKYILGTYTIKQGTMSESDALIAVGKEGRNDAFISTVTILSIVIFMFTGFSLDAYASLFFSFIVLKAGFEALKNTTDEIIGRPGKLELASKLYDIIRNTEGIECAADMMLHNYGPGKYSGSCNIEIDHKQNIGDIYKHIHELQLSIMKDYNVTMVFGIYAVNNDDASSLLMRKQIQDYIDKHDHMLSFHALYTTDTDIYVDIVLDYEAKDWQLIKEEFKAYMHDLYPSHTLHLVLETEYV